MSQQKVDKYKENKANRQEIIKKEKLFRRLEYTAAIVVLVAIVGWIGFSAYAKAKAAAPVKQYVMDTTAVDEYIYSVGNDDEDDVDVEDLADLDSNDEIDGEEDAVEDEVELDQDTE